MMNIETENYKSSNVLSVEQAVKKREELKKSGKKVGLCSGSFDLLQPGHITHLESAKKVCDVLIVAIANDSFSKKKYNENGRPIFSDKIRAFMISQLKPVDFVIIDDGSVNTFFLIKPDIYIKGADYTTNKDKEPMKAKEIVKSLGGEVYYTQDEKLSASEVINYIKKEVKS